MLGWELSQPTRGLISHINGPIASDTELQQEGPYNMHKDILKASYQVIKEIGPLGHTGHLFHKAIPYGMGVIAELSDI